MISSIKVAPKVIDANSRQAIESLLRKASSADAKTIDTNSDGYCSRGEAIHFIYNHKKWRNYLPELHKMGLVHPLTNPHFQQMITTLAKQTSDAQVAADYYFHLANQIDPQDPKFAEYLEIITHIFPNYYLMHILKAKRYNSLGKKQLAVDEQGKAISANPHEYASYAVFFYLLKKLGPAEALRSAQKLVKDNPNSAYALLVLADLCSERDICDTQGSALQKDLPRSGNGEVLLAFHAVKQNKLRQARSLVKSALVLNPQNAIAHHLAGKLDLINGDLKAAKKHIEAAIKGAPQLPKNHAMLSAIYLQQGKTTEAIIEATKEAQVFYGNPQALLSMAQNAIVAGQLNMAFAFASAYASIVPNDPTGHLMLSEIYLSAGYTAESESSAQKALTLAGSNKFARAEVRSQLSSLALIDADLKAARDYAADAIKDNPKSLAARGARFYVLLMENKFDDARKMAEGLTRDFPQLSISWGLASQVYRLINQPAKARAAAAKALQLNPKEPTALFTNMLLLLEQNKISEARREFYKMGSSYGGVVVGYGLFAHAAYLVGDKKMARELAKRVLKIFPKDQEGLWVQGLLQIEDGQLQTAEITAKKIKQLYPTLSSGPFLLAKVHYERRDYKSAEAAVHEALRLYPYDSGRIPAISSKRLLIDILKAQGKYQEAKNIEASISK